LTPAICGDRKYRGSYRRGDPQKTSRPQEVVPKTWYAVSAHGAPSTTFGVLPGTHDGSSQLSACAGCADTAVIPAETMDSTVIAATTVDRTAAL
jgi:hypothetical protein